jgi:hypothetical protein
VWDLTLELYTLIPLTAQQSHLDSDNRLAAKSLRISSGLLVIRPGPESQRGRPGALHRLLKIISGGWTPRSMASALFKIARVQSSVLKRSVTTSSITASAAGTPPNDQALSSVRVAA